jgi:rSAM/selenodomain-associated transferase 1
VDYLGIFAKYWQPGEVKTRLAKVIGAEPASELYKAFLSGMLKQFAHVGERRELCYSPSDQRDAFMAMVGSNWDLSPQTRGDLGDRMRHFFTQAFKRGAQRVVLLGSDSPTLPTEFVQQAFQSLRTCPVALGPTEDGGYYLVGASQHVPPIFDGVDWSTSEVWRQTVEHLAAAECPFAELPAWYDVDEMRDLSRLLTDLKRQHTTELGSSDLLSAAETAFRCAREDDARLETTDGR